MIKKIKILIALLSFLVQSYGQQWENFNTSNCGLDEDGIQASLITTNDEIWVSYANPLSTGGGVSRFDGLNWVYYDTGNSGLPSNDIRVITEDTLGRIWFGTFQNGIGMYDGNQWTKYDTSNSNIIGQRCRMIEIDPSDNSVWIASTFDGISKFDGSTWTNYDTAMVEELEIANINTMFIDTSNFIWIGLHGGGLVKYDKTLNTWEQFNGSNSQIPCEYVGSINRDTQGLLWLAFYFQCPMIASFDGINWNVYYPYVLSNTTTALDGLKFDLEGNLWAGSRGEGLWKFDGSVWINETSGIPGNSVAGYHNSILITSTNQIWWTTINDGIYTNDTNYTTLNEPDNVKFEVYPNPSNGLYNVIPPSKLGYYSLTVIDINGREILSSGKITGKYTFNLSNLASGMYYIKINVDGTTAYSKIIKD